MTQEEYRDAAIAAVRQLSKDVGIPEKNEHIREEDLEQLAKMLWQMPAIRATPERQHRNR